MVDRGYAMFVLAGLVVVVVMATSVSGECKDILSNCAAYKIPSDCTTYAQWAKTQCQKTCNLCGKKPNPPKPDPYTCEFNGQKHHKGQSWIVDCRDRCTCTGTGQYPISCNALCWDYDIPPSCTWKVAAAGKCCKTPQCPPGVKVKYPPGYKAN